MESVVSMYEDRFDLRTFQRHVVENSKSTAENFQWWRKLGIKKSAPLLLESSFVVIAPVSVSVKRTKELRALNGWYALLLSITYFLCYPKTQKKGLGECIISCSLWTYVVLSNIHFCRIRVPFVLTVILIIHCLGIV